GTIVTSGDVYRAFARLWRSESGAPDPVPIDEDSPRRASASPDGSPGEYDNLDAEQAAESQHVLPVTILRLGAVYGPGDPQRRLRPYLSRMTPARAELPIDERVARWRWSRVHVHDAADAIARAATDDRATGRVYNVAEAVART